MMADAKTLPVPVAAEKKPKINPILLALVVGNMQAFGLTLENLDQNSTGKDDVVGVMLVAGAEVFEGFMSSNDSKLDKAMVAINKSSAAYCLSRNLPIAAG
jgi:hypothetical protein